MSITSALSSATAGLHLIQADMAVVAENIAAVNDPNRTRQAVERSTDASGQVTTGKYTRATDTALSNQLNEMISEQSAAETRNTYLKRVSDLYGISSDQTKLTRLMDDFTAAWGTLAATPESDVAKGEVVRLGDSLAREVRRTANGVEDIKRDIDDSVEDQLDDLNTLLASAHQANLDIVEQKANDQPTGPLEDRRDAIIRDISKIITVRAVPRGDGRVALFTPSGTALVDAMAVSFHVDRGKLVSSTGQDLPRSTFGAGSLGAMLELVADGSQSDPPKPANTNPASELIRKLRSQLDTIAGALSAPTKPGQPTSFNDAYASGPTQAGELDRFFFSGKNRFDIAVNTTLVDGSRTVKVASIPAAFDAWKAGGRSFVSDGLTIADGNYGDFISDMVSKLSLTQKNAEAEATALAETRDQLEQRFQSLVGVNLDDEVVRLQILQRNYAASAQVVNTTKEMLDALERIFS